MIVAVIGAGVAGSFLASLLARSGIPCLIFSKNTGREKPCGGGCTPKVTSRYPIFPTTATPRNLVYRIRYRSSGRHIDLDLTEPIWIYSRRELDGMLLDDAVSQGARLVCERAIHFSAGNRGWAIRGSEGTEHRADYLVGADGAGSSVRRAMGIQFGVEDLSATLGYYVPSSVRQDWIDIRFLDPKLSGYLWAFPRENHVSVGLITRYREMSSSRMRETLDRYLKDLYGEPDTSNYQGYSAPVPTLSENTIRNLRVSGENWALVGDAAGFADPITAEGISYAMRSAEILAQALLGPHPSEVYSRRWREDFGDELLQAARYKDRFYHGRFFGDTFINRMLQMTGRSATVRKAQNDLIAGRVGYRELKRQLLRNAPRVLWQTLMG